MSLIILLVLKIIINGTTGMRTGMELEHEQLVKGMVKVNWNGTRT